MRITSLPVLCLPILLAAGAASAQGAQTVPGHAPGLSQPAPSVDTSPNPTGTMGAPSGNPQSPSSTGSTTPDTMQPGAKSSINAGASGRNPCYPGQSGKPVGSTNPSGQASRC